MRQPFPSRRIAPRTAIFFPAADCGQSATPSTRADSRSVRNRPPPAAVPSKVAAVQEVGEPERRRLDGLDVLHLEGQCLARPDDPREDETPADLVVRSAPPFQGPQTVVGSLLVPVGGDEVGEELVLVRPTVDPQDAQASGLAIHRRRQGRIELRKRPRDLDDLAERDLHAVDHDVIKASSRVGPGVSREAAECQERDRQGVFAHGVWSLAIGRDWIRWLRHPCLTVHQVEKAAS